MTTATQLLLGTDDARRVAYLQQLALPPANVFSIDVHFQEDAAQWEDMWSKLEHFLKLHVREPRWILISHAEGLQESAQARLRALMEVAHGATVTWIVQCVDVHWMMDALKSRFSTTLKH
jgi:hypothetical protein